jgi:hypothetical protein
MSRPLFDPNDPFVSNQDLIASAHDVLAEVRYGLETEEGALAMVIDTDPEWLDASFEYLSEVLETATGEASKYQWTMSRRRKPLETQRFCLLQIHCDWLDAQGRAGIDDNCIARAAVSEFLYAIQEQERQLWIADVRASLPARTSKIDVILNAALSQFISRHHAEFIEAP